MAKIIHFTIVNIKSFCEKFYNSYNTRVVFMIVKHLYDGGWVKALGIT